MVTLFARILGAGSHMRSDLLEAMLSAYNDELTQIAYTPEYANFKRLQKSQVKKQRAKQRMQDDALLKKLEGYTATDEEVPLPRRR